MTDGSDKVHSTSSPRSLEAAKKDLHAILGHVEDLGLTSRALRLSRAHSRLKFGKRFRFTRKHLWFTVILSFVVYRYAKNYLMPSRNDKCLFSLPSMVHKAFRPAEDCSMCAGIQQVDKVSDIDPEQFEERYAYSGRPVVVTDAMTNWTAPNVFSFSFFKSLYKDHEGNCQFFPYKTEFRSLQEVFNMSTVRALLQSGSKPWYIGWSNCDEKIGTILRKHYHRPYFLPTNAESEKTDWIFMGSTGYGAHMHVDDVEHPSWQAQLRGEKLWTLEPPRECYYACDRMEITVLPGEIIVLDTNRWYHQTMIVSEEMSITIGAEFD